MGWALGGPHVGPAIKEMPSTMKKLAAVQFFTWLGLFCMWMFFGLATAQHEFSARANSERADDFDEGTAFGGRTFMLVFGGFALPWPASCPCWRK